MAHPALVRFGGNIVRVLTATGVAIAASAAPAAMAAVTPFVLPATVGVAAVLGVGLVIKGLSSRL